MPPSSKKSGIKIKIIAATIILISSCFSPDEANNHKSPDEISDYEFLNEGGDCIDYFYYEFDRNNECYFENTKTKAFCLSREHQVTQEIQSSFIHNSRDIIILSTNAGPTKIITQNGFHTCGDKPGDVCVHPLASCQEKTNQNTTTIEHLSYSIQNGDNDISEYPVHYNMCTFMSLQGSLILVNIKSKVDFILSDHCEGGEYSNSVVIYDTDIIDVIYGDMPQGDITLYGFAGIVDKSRIGNTFLASARRYQDKYFLDFSLEASINGEVQNNVPDDVILDIPNDYMELVTSARETAMNLENCENVNLLSDEEYDKFIAGDPEECVLPEDEEEEGPDWDAICAAEDAPECCFNDLVECEE